MAKVPEAVISAIIGLPRPRPAGFLSCEGGLSSASFIDDAPCEFEPRLTCNEQLLVLPFSQQN